MRLIVVLKSWVISKKNYFCWLEISYNIFGLMTLVCKLFIFLVILLIRRCK